MKGIADIEIIDAHHHLWDLQANYYPWLTDRITKRVCGEYSAIRKNYLIEDFLRDSAEVNLFKSVHVQAACDDPLAETKWLNQVANHPDSGGFPHAIVANVDFSEKNAQELLEKQASFQRVTGIRQMLHEGLIDPQSTQPSHLENPVWMKNFALLEQVNLTFDLQVYYQQTPLAERLLKAHTNIQFILCHTGQPARRDEEGVAGWKKSIKQLARYENLVLKISGMGMFDRNWTTGSIRPFVLFAIETFGPERCIFGSNFPVDGMMTTYKRLWQAYSDITRDFSEDERVHLFSKNAQGIYFKGIN